MNCELCKAPVRIHELPGAWRGHKRGELVWVRSENRDDGTIWTGAPYCDNRDWSKRIEEWPQHHVTPLVEVFAGLSLMAEELV